jgi:hypothetical protein
MNRRLLRGLLALYPRAFRDRYGAELASLTDDLISAGEITALLAALNLLRGAALEWGRVLTDSRRAGLAVAAAAVMAATGSVIVAAAGIFSVTSHARPQGTAASVHSVSAPAVIAQPGTSCVFIVKSAALGTVQIAAGSSAAAKIAPTSGVLVPTMILVPATLGVDSRPLPHPAAIPACVIWTTTPLPAGSNPALGFVFVLPMPPS